jgi:hypothetical protein
VNERQVDIGRLKRAAQNLFDPQAESFEIFLPFAGTQQDHQARGLGSGLQFAEEVAIATVSEAFFAKDDGKLARAKGRTSARNGGDRVRIDWQVFEDAHQ